MYSIPTIFSQTVFASLREFLNAKRGSKPGILPLNSDGSIDSPTGFHYYLAFQNAGFSTCSRED
jgi:hypothetical protein